MIEIEGLSKVYKGFTSKYQRLLCVLSMGLYSGSSKYKALSDINLCANSGDMIGIIGRNGAGKSTLLKILSGVSGSDTGSIKTSGRIRPMLELGVGFNPELTAKENIYFNGLLWGFSKNELDSLLDEIFEFAGLKGFENQILKNYSTGMIMRLGFSLATANRPEILLIDEALAVGDASFQIKCITRFRDFLSAGSTIIVVSHDLQLLGAICSKILLLEKGKAEYFGSPTEALRRYIQILGSSGEKILKPKEDFLEYTIELYDSQKKTQKIFFMGNIVFLKIQFIFKYNINRVTIGFQIDDIRGIRVFGTNSYLLGKEIRNVEKDRKYTVYFQFPLNFREGKYSLGFSIHEGENHTEGSFLWKDAVLDFEIERIDIPKFDGLCYLPTTCTWE